MRERRDPTERMRRGGSPLAKRTKCIQAASLKATIYTKTALLLEAKGYFSQGGGAHVEPQ